MMIYYATYATYYATYATYYATLQMIIGVEYVLLAWSSFEDENRINY